MSDKPLTVYTADAWPVVRLIAERDGEGLESAIRRFLRLFDREMSDAEITALVAQRSAEELGPL